MNLYSVLSFIAFLLYLQAGAVILYKSPRNPINIVFSILCLSFSIFSLFSSFIYSATTIEQVYFYDKLASIGWTTFPFLMVLFFYLLSNYKSKLIKNFIYFNLIPVSAFSLIVVFFKLESLKLYYNYAETWIFNLNTNSPWVYIFVFYLFFSVVLSLYILISWYVHSQTNRGKRQAVIILFSLIVFVIASTVTNIILPFLDILVVPALAPVNSILWIGGVFYAMTRYGRNILSPDIISNLLMNHVNKFILFLTSDKNIFAVNKYTLHQLSYTDNEISNVPPRRIFSNSYLIDFIIREIEKKSFLSEINADIVSSQGHWIPVLLSGMKIRDKYKNHLGYVMIGSDNRQKQQLRREIAERIRVENALNNKKSELELLVQKNTRELSEANRKLKIEILERERAEAQIMYDLEEKSELVREVNHRVKNNIQMIISLINMLLTHKDLCNKGYDILTQISEHMRVFSDWHDYFYASDNFSKIDFSKFIEKVTDELNYILGYNKNVRYEYNLSEKFLEIQQAIACGIIYYELLSNSLKYAFNNNNTHNNDESNRECTIKVELLKENNEYIFSVSDNGEGISNIMNFEKSDSIGFQIVNIITKDYLKGNVEVKNLQGTKFSISFST